MKHFSSLFYLVLCFEGTISEVKVDPEEEPTPSNNTGAGEALLMNNGSRDTSHSDIQKLQQQLQDIKEQVRVPSASRFVMRRFNETNNLICVEERSPHRALYNYLSLLKNRNTFSRNCVSSLLVASTATLTAALPRFYFISFKKDSEEVRS